MIKNFNCMDIHVINMMFKCSISKKDVNKIYNTCIVFCSTGEQLAKFRKVVLFHFTRSFLCVDTDIYVNLKRIVLINSQIITNKTKKQTHL